MNRKCLSGILFFILTTLCAAQPNDKESVAKQLQSFYAQGTPPPWEIAIKELAAGNQEIRAAAATYLVSLLDQAQADERSGKAPWRQTPYWGRGPDNPAHNLREQIAEKLANSPDTSATLTVVRWYLEQEKSPDFQATAAAALQKAQGKEADEICLRLLQQPHENGIVILAALKSLEERKTNVPDAALKVLCNHNRSRVRLAARKLNKELGRPDPADFDQVAAIQRPAIATLMTKIGALLDQPAPVDAPFVKVTTKRGIDRENESDTTLGWLVKDGNDSWILSTPFGHRETFHKEKKTNDRRGREIVETSRWEKASIAEEVKRVVELRKKGDPQFALLQGGRATGQFQGRGAGVYEVILAHWLYAAKQFDLSAQILFPALDTIYMDGFLVDMTRHRVGEAMGYRMLVAFAGDRDFGETLRLARIIVERFSETRFSAYAVRLSLEIPKRQDDFKKFKLPTPQEWAALKTKLSRTEQISYLAERLRLLNCFQWEQPGGYDLAEVQYAESRGMAPDATWGGTGGKTRLINPYLELVGGEEFDINRGEKKTFKGMELTIADVPQLATFLRDDWHILCVSFHRNFAPGRHLDTTRSLIGSIINDLAKHELCRTRAMEQMSEREIASYIEGMARWAKANTNKNDRDLLWSALEKEIQAGALVTELPNIERLVVFKDKRLRPVLFDYLNNFDKKGGRPNPNEIRIQGIDVSASSYHLRTLLSYCLRYDAQAFKEPARKFANHKNPDIRMLVARILFEGGEASAGRKIFIDILENGDPRQIDKSELPGFIEVLLREGSRDSRQAVRLIFKSKLYAELENGKSRADLVKRCGAGGIGDGYLSYLPLLEMGDRPPGNRSDSRKVADGELVANEIFAAFASSDLELQRIQKEFPKWADQIAPLKAWLKARAKSVDR